MSLEIWQPTDVVCRILFVVIAIILKEPVRSSEARKDIKQYKELKGA